MVVKFMNIFANQLLENTCEFRGETLLKHTRAVFRELLIRWREKSWRWREGGRQKERKTEEAEVKEGGRKESGRGERERGMVGGKEGQEERGDKGESGGEREEWLVGF